MSNQEYIEDEVDLRDYINVILKRKKIILVVFFVAVIATTIVSFLMPKVYEVSTTIKIGAISEPLISKPEAIQMLKRQKTLNAVIKELGLDTDILELKDMIKIEEIKDTNFFKLKIQNSDPDLAVKILNALSNPFILKGREIYNKKTAFLNEQLQELEKRSKLIEGQIKKLNQLIRTRPANSDFPLLQNTLTNYEDIYGSLRDRICSLKGTLLNSQKFEVFELPVKPKYPIKPKKKEMVAISGILGLFLGVFVAFFQEFWEKGK